MRTFYEPSHRRPYAEQRLVAVSRVMYVCIASRLAAAVNQEYGAARAGRED